MDNKNNTMDSPSQSQPSTPPSPSSPSGNTDMVKIVSVAVMALVLGLVIGYVVGNSGNTDNNTDTNTTTSTSAFPADIANEWYSDVQGVVTAITQETITIDKIDYEDSTQPSVPLTLTLDLQDYGDQSPVQLLRYTVGQEDQRTQQDSSLDAIQVGNDVGIRVSTMDGGNITATLITIFETIEDESPDTTETERDDESSL